MLTQIFSGRAECMADVEQVIEILHKQRTPMNRIRTDLGYFGNGIPSGEVMVEFSFIQPTEQEWLMDIIRQVPDSHVLLQTLRPIPLAQNNCERDYAIV